MESSNFGLVLKVVYDHTACVPVSLLAFCLFICLRRRAVLAQFYYYIHTTITIKLYCLNLHRQGMITLWKFDISLAAATLFFALCLHIYIYIWEHNKQSSHT